MLFRSFIIHVMCVGALKLRSIFPKNIHEIYFLESVFLITSQPLQGFLAVPYSSVTRICCGIFLFSFLTLVSSIVLTVLLSLPKSLHMH